MFVGIFVFRCSSDFPVGKNNQQHLKQTSWVDAGVCVCLCVCVCAFVAWLCCVCVFACCLGAVCCAQIVSFFVVLFFFSEHIPEIASFLSVSLGFRVFRFAGFRRSAWALFWFLLLKP